MDLSQFSTPEIAVAMVITGLVVVFCALVGLWAIVALVGKAFVSVKKTDAPAQPASGAPAPAPKAPVPVASPAMQVEDGIGDEVVAVIAAAVTAMSGGKAVISSVRCVKEARSGWAQAGVMQNTSPF